jgi:hypothetical protein
VCVCVCEHVNACTYICTYVSTHTHTHTHIHAYLKAEATAAVEGGLKVGDVVIAQGAWVEEV